MSVPAPDSADNEARDLLHAPGALDEIWAAEAEIAQGDAIGADELRRLMEQRMRA
jgi:hypothetical protein